MLRFTQRFAVTSLLALTAVAASPTLADAEAACSGAQRSAAKLGQRATAKATLCLLNVERAASGLSKLRLDRRLNKAARGHARDMVVRQYFAHDSKSGASYMTRIKRTGWMRSRRSWAIGENIGYGTGAQASPSKMVASWMGSDAHRANILTRRFRLIGIGVHKGTPTGRSGATYATDFGG